jgi:hypothetical protein
MRRCNQIDSGLYRTPSVLYNDFEEQEFCDEENNQDTVDIGLEDDDLDIMRFVSDNTQNDINVMLSYVDYNKSQLCNLIYNKLKSKKYILQGYI